jgi:hypothetical protein
LVTTKKRKKKEEKKNSRGRKCKIYIKSIRMRKGWKLKIATTDYVETEGGKNVKG